MNMIDRLRGHIGENVQVATPLDVAEGVLVSVDSSCLTLRTSKLAGYDHGDYIVFPLHYVSYVRLGGRENPSETEG